jgi:hypothetical protein
MHQQRTAWSDFFPGSPTANFNSQTYTSHQSSSSTGVYVSNCLFKGCISTSDGGAMRCWSSVAYLLVESSSFFSCKVNNTWGGGICFYSPNTGQCVLNKVCGYDCYSIYSSSSGQFAWIYVNNTAPFKNHVNYSSISRCVNEKSNHYYSLCLQYGIIYCPSLNISMNKCNYYTGICCYPFIDSNSVTCSLSYSTFADNNAFGYGCIYFCRGEAKYEIKSCNILRNTQGTTSYGTIFTKGILNIEDSCILENTASTIFYSSSSSYTITLTRCTVDKTTSNGYLTTQNTIPKSFILALNHMSTQNCNAKYDSVGTLTAIPYISQPTKEIFYFCYTCKNQGRISVYFSINSMLLFAFIHPNPSGDF